MKGIRTIRNTKKGNSCAVISLILAWCQVKSIPVIAVIDKGTAFTRLTVTIKTCAYNNIRITVSVYITGRGNTYSKIGRSLVGFCYLGVGKGQGINCYRVYCTCCVYMDLKVRGHDTHAGRQYLPVCIPDMEFSIIDCNNTP